MLAANNESPKRRNLKSDLDSIFQLNVATGKITMTDARLKMEMRTAEAHNIALSYDYRPLTNFVSQSWPPQNLRKIDYDKKNRI